MLENYCALFGKQRFIVSDYQAVLVVEDVLSLVMVMVRLVIVTIVRETKFAVYLGFGTSEANPALIASLYQSWTIIAVRSIGTILHQLSPQIMVHLLQ